MKNAGFAITALLIASTSVHADAEREQEFVKKAAISNQFEIASSELAVERAENAVVRDFAERMIADHETAGKDLKAAVDDSGLRLTVPEALDQKHEKMVQELSRSNGGEFDAKYIEMQAAAHEEAVDLFEDFSDEEDADSSLREFAIKTLPTLQTHEHRVEGIADQDLEN